MKFYFTHHYFLPNKKCIKISQKLPKKIHKNEVKKDLLYLQVVLNNLILVLFHEIYIISLKLFFLNGCLKLIEFLN